MEIDIRIATTEEELEAIYRFRYAIYVEEMRRPQKDADHERKRIVDKLDPGAFVFGAWEGNEVVGTIRANLLRHTSVGEYHELYALDRLPHELLKHTSITTRLMIHPRLRGSTLGMRLLCAMYDFGMERAIAVDVMDCNAHLVPFFSGLGYIPHRAGVVHPEYGNVTVMRINLLDVLHLNQMRSPFRRRAYAWMRARAAASDSPALVPTLENYADNAH